MRIELAVATVASILLSAHLLAAQQPAAGKLEGSIREGGATRPGSAASVSVVRLEPEPSVSFSATADARGHYAIASLPAGRYLLQLNSPTLDSLDIALPSAEVAIAAGSTTRRDLALPYGAPLRDAICHGLTLGKGKAVIAGRTVDADTDRPIAGADVVATWQEVSVDRKSLRSTVQKRAAVVRSGVLGEYRMCGVPSDRTLSMQLQHYRRAGAIVRVSVSEDEGAVVRDMSLSPRTAPTIAVLDSVEHLGVSADSTREELQLTGTATLTGTVRESSGRPLADVLVHVRDARSSAITDTAGRFTIAGLPAGTQVLLVRELGYTASEVQVELRGGRAARREITLARAVTLDSVHVVAPRAQGAEFEFNRRNNTFGRFLTVSDIELMKPRQTSDLLQRMGGFSIVGRGSEARVLSNMAQAAKPQCRNANVVIEGVEEVAINDIAPNQIGGLEAYREGAFAPARFAGRADCGLIVIWMKANNGRGTRTAGDAAALRGNGYP